MPKSRTKGIRSVHELIQSAEKAPAEEASVPEGVNQV